jgi:hypothetical protein
MQRSRDKKYTRAFTRQRPSKEVPAAKNPRATVEVLLETVFPVVRAADVVRQRRGEHVSAATNPDATVDILLKTVFSTWSMQNGL